MQNDDNHNIHLNTMNNFLPKRLEVMKYNYNFTCCTHNNKKHNIDMDTDTVTDTVTDTATDAATDMDSCTSTRSDYQDRVDDDNDHNHLFNCENYSNDKDVDDDNNSSKKNNNENNNKNNKIFSTTKRKEKMILPKALVVRKTNVQKCSIRGRRKKTKFSRRNAMKITIAKSDSASSLFSRFTTSSLECGAVNSLTAEADGEIKQNQGRDVTPHRRNSLGIIGAEIEFSSLCISEGTVLREG